MSIARVSGSHAQVTYANDTVARTVAYGGNLTSGSLLVVTVGIYLDVTVTVSDSTNGSYTQAGTYSHASTNLIVSQWYFPNNAATGTPTLTVTPSGSAYLALAVEEFTGIAPTSPLEATGGTFTTSSTPTTGTVTATAGDLVVASLSFVDNVTSSSANSPFTLMTNLAPGGGIGLATAYDLAAPGNESATFNLSGVADVAMLIVSYLQGAAAAPTRRRLGLLGVG